MDVMYRCLFFLILTTSLFKGTGLFPLSVSSCHAQTPGAVVYMDEIGDRYTALSEEFYRYLSAAAHAGSPRKVDKRREALIETAWETFSEVRTMPSFRGDRALRDSSANYLRIYYRVLTEQYEQILDMEAIAETSAHAMEAYIRAQREARNRLDVANVRMLAAQKRFAAAHNIPLQLRSDELFQKMKATNEALTFVQHLQLIFTRSHFQEMVLMETVSDRDSAAMARLRPALEESCDEGLDQLFALTAYSGDPILNDATRDLLFFYRKEAGTYTDLLQDYIRAEAGYKKARAKWDATSGTNRTADAAEAFNQTVRVLNEAADAYNSANREMNDERARQLSAWQLAYRTFLDRHIPVF